MAASDEADLILIAPALSSSGETVVSGPTNARVDFHVSDPDEASLTNKSFPVCQWARWLSSRGLRVAAQITVG